jgi:lipid-A-disaccharide synthase
MNLPMILESAVRLGPEYEFLLPVAPTLDRGFLEALIGPGLMVRLVGEALPALVHSRAGIIASGTATVEAAMMGTPFVMVYRVSPLTYFLGRSRVKVPYFAMVNLIAGKEIVPELVQHDFTAENVVGRLQEILPDGDVRTGMIEGLGVVRKALQGSDTGRAPSAARAADELLTFLHRVQDVS